MDNIKKINDVRINDVKWDKDDIVIEENVNEYKKQIINLLKLTKYEINYELALSYYETLCNDIRIANRGYNFKSWLVTPINTKTKREYTIHVWYNTKVKPRIIFINWFTILNNTKIIRISQKYGNIKSNKKIVTNLPFIDQLIPQPTTNTPQITNTLTNYYIPTTLTLPNSSPLESQIINDLTNNPENTLTWSALHDLTLDNNSQYLHITTKILELLQKIK